MRILIILTLLTLPTIIVGQHELSKSENRSADAIARQAAAPATSVERLTYISADEAITVLRQLEMIGENLLATPSPNGDSILFRLKNPEDDERAALEAAIEVIEHIDVPDLNPSAAPTSAQDVVVRDSNQTKNVRTLKSGYEDSERKAAQLARQLRELKATASPDTERIEKLSQSLRMQVKLAFSTRIQLQQAELDEAEANIKTSRQRLARRQQLADQIIEHRVVELESGSDTSWLSEVSSKLSTSSGKSSTIEPKPRLVAELQGRWRVQTALDGFEVGIVSGRMVLGKDEDADAPPGVTREEMIAGPYILEFDGTTASLRHEPSDFPYRMWQVSSRDAGGLLVRESDADDLESCTGDFMISGNRLRLCFRQSEDDSLPKLMHGRHVMYFECERKQSATSSTSRSAEATSELQPNNN